MNNDNIISATFPVLNMACAACSAAVEQTLRKQKGVVEATVNLAAAQAHVVYDMRTTSPHKLAKAVKSAGFVLVEPSDDTNELVAGYHRERARRWRIRTIGSTLFFIPLMILSMTMPDIAYLHYILWALATPVLVVFGADFYKGAWQQALHGRANMDTLVAISTATAYLFSLFNTLFPEFWMQRGIEPHVYFEASAGIVTFVSIGKMLEERAKENTTTAISKLMGLQPQEVTRITDNGEMEVVPIASIVEGDTLIAHPGDRIAVDGIVSGGNSYIDESMLTGESMPIHKQSGNTIYAGTLNGKGALYYTAHKTGDATLLSQIIRVVQEAQGSKAPVQRLVDKVASIFVPIVIAIAITAFAVWMLAGGNHAITHALLAFVTVLVIACPCALGLATPTAITVGIGKAAQHGILIKSAEALEKTCRTTAVVLDKTGTITQGSPAVVHTHWCEEALAKHVLYNIEIHSEHPLAQAIVSYLNNSTIEEITEYKAIPGRGVTASIKGERYYVGNTALLQEQGIAINPALLNKALAWEHNANTIVWVAATDRVLAVLSVADPVKATSKETIERLKQAGIKVYMLTGDNRHTAHAIAQQVGINNVVAEVLPEEKAAYVKQLQQNGEIVAMIGDGINDSAALAQADVSIAMGHGSDIAMDVATMTIISSDLTHIVEAIHISRQTTRTIRQNLFWAFIYNIIGIPIAAGALYPSCGFLLNPMIASAAMALSSVCVVSNSILLKWKK